MDTSLVAFLAWLAGGAGAMVAVSFLLERIAAFQALSDKNKGLVVLTTAIVVGLGSFAILSYVPAAILTAAEPYFKILAVIVAGWLASQWGHGWDPATIKYQ